MGKNKIKTSVVIPVYNTEKYLEACIKSVLSQTQKEIEIILVDDGSTDKSGDIIKSYEQMYPVVKAIYQDNKKLGAARNVAIQIASGQYIYFLDSDDYIDETLFEHCYQIAEEKSLDFVMFDGSSFIDGDEKEIEAIVDIANYSRSNLHIEDKVYNGLEFWNQYFYQGGVFSNACLVYINSEFLKKNNLFFESGIYYEDNDWILRMYLCAERIMYKSWQFHFRRYRAGSIMTISYTDLHVKSNMVECKKILQILLNEEKETKRKIIYSKFRNMFYQFERIFGIYCETNCLNKVYQDFVDFYEYILRSCPDIFENNIAMEIIDLMKRLKDKLQEKNIITDLSENDLGETRIKILVKECQAYPLNIKDLNIGIYGTGLICEKFLVLYQKHVSELLANIFFIDTNKESGEKYQNFPLYNVKDLNQLKIDCIIIASNRYKKEMQENVRKYLYNEVEILFVPELLRYFSKGE